MTAVTQVKPMSTRHAEPLERPSCSTPPPATVWVVGEALFDCFPATNELPAREVLGGAPLNVAWNLAQLGAPVRFVGGLGADAAGDRVRAALAALGVGVDASAVVPRGTGRVDVRFEGGEPVYDIAPDQAFDHLPQATVDTLCARLSDDPTAWLYHGSLAFRSPAMAEHLERLKAAAHRRFVDVNLRAPWFDLDAVRAWAVGADVVKLNADEWALLDPLRGMTPQVEATVGDDGPSPDRWTAIGTAASATAAAWRLQQGLVVTFGARGALWAAASGDWMLAPTELAWLARQAAPDDAVRRADGATGDVVGAGDALSAALLAGLSGALVIPDDLVLLAATRFAGAVTRLHGATTDDTAWYRAVVTALRDGLDEAAAQLVFGPARHRGRPRASPVGGGTEAG